ncbi:acyl carrier protein [Paenibacillus athensensis]|uniref:Carrier domain-containing protein n=1 Tax=Paenibacillus athensensis TaxID=1967502 RepID=A0A4Y8QCB3_9BACL|nr:acyl carrier protein [Paenibacillus athensensis]MCD1257612.1 acyl carrier protein [Paenibacillus athensensis]
MAVTMETLRRLAAGVLQLDSAAVETLTPDTDLRGLGLSSISAMELVVALENEYGFIVEEDDLLLDSVNTLEKLEKLAVKHLTAV